VKNKPENQRVKAWFHFLMNSASSVNLFQNKTKFTLTLDIQLLSNQVKHLMLQSLVTGCQSAGQVMHGRGVRVEELVMLTDDLLLELYSPDSNDSSRNLALDRFGQAVQSIISTACISGNTRECTILVRIIPVHNSISLFADMFLSKLASIPETRLLRILKIQYRIS